jgi:hypothetical protein
MWTTPPGHVHHFALKFAYEIDRADNPSAGLFCTFNQRFKPTGRDQSIVVKENNILGIYLAHAEIARLVRRQILRPTDELKPSAETLARDSAGSVRVVRR